MRPEGVQEVNRGLKILNPTGKTAEDYTTQIRKNPRMRYSVMRGRQEMAAQALAVGSTQRMAAKYAGVSQRQVKKYYADPDFRARIEELRATLASRMKGRIMRELNRRLTGVQIQSMDTLEMLRIFDRITVGGKGMAINVAGDVNVNNKYEQILNALFSPDAPGDGEDFPQFGDRGLTVSGSSTPIDE